MLLRGKDENRLELADSGYRELRERRLAGRGIVVKKHKGGKKAY